MLNMSPPKDRDLPPPPYTVTDNHSHAPTTNIYTYCIIWSVEWNGLESTMNNTITKLIVCGKL